MSKRRRLKKTEIVMLLVLRDGPIRGKIRFYAICAYAAYLLEWRRTALKFAKMIFPSIRGIKHV